MKSKEIYLLKERSETRYGKVMRHVIKAPFLNKDTGQVSSLENPEVLETIKHLNANSSLS
ncbi:hypothetical protein [Peribacillus simplex]|uniref:hypothetical protein n=1 Tax=Peribacillus simplex TaxID=1478 RepID=UPI0012DAF514|nr:hypothetical protein [Peribacillus simplex]